MNSTGKRMLNEYSNYGELLYQRGMRRKEELKKHIERAKSEQDKQELAEVSFKPSIN